MTFTLDQDELAKLLTWRTTHDKTCPHTLHQGAIGGRFTYSFTPTSLGRVTEVKCSCGAGVDLTDYDW